MKRINSFEGFNEEQKPDYMRDIKREKKGKPETYDLASNVIGDGKEPNLYFVTSSNDYMYLQEGTEDYVYYFSSIESIKKAPVKIEQKLITEIFGPYETAKEASDKAKDIELNEEIGPRSVVIEDRKSGMVYQKYMQAVKKVVWSEEVSGEI